MYFLALCFCWEYRILLLVSGFHPFPSFPLLPILFLRFMNFFTACTYFNTLRSFFSTLSSLLVLIQTATWGGWLALRGHQRRADRQRPNRDSISWRKSSPRKDPVHDSDIRYVVVSSLYSLSFRTLTCLDCVIVANAFTSPSLKWLYFSFYADWHYIVIAFVIFLAIGWLKEL